MTPIQEISSLLRAQAEAAVASEPLLANSLRRCLLSQPDFGAMLAALIAVRLADAYIGEPQLERLFAEQYAASPEIAAFALEDLLAVRRRDPASQSELSIMTNQKGFLALQTHRLAHALWQSGRTALAASVQGMAARVFGVDIHPACKIGYGTMFDHGTGLVIGETCVIGNEVSIMQSVTLGGTGKASGDRHPKIGDGVLIGAGAKVLGNIVIGQGAKIGAGSVVLQDVPPHTTVVGNPATIVGAPRCARPSEEMDQNVLDDRAHRESLTLVRRS